MKNKIKVSIIAPVYNDEKHIGKLLESLQKQNYPENLIEIIIIDNNSTDRTRKIVKQYPVKLLEEKNIQSSYAARNKGIAYAKGKILAFIDSDCIANRDWISEGVAALQTNSADLVGGKVEFYFSKKKTAAEYYDSITHFNMEKSIRERGSTGTGNLFVWHKVFKKLGRFPDNVQSGGDYQWTSTATINGFLLVYAENVIVKHPARTLKELLKKRYRIGGGRFHVWRKEKKPLLKIVGRLIRWCVPPHPTSIKKMAYKTGRPVTFKKMIKIWMITYLCKITYILGILAPMFNFLSFNKNRLKT